MAQVLLLSELMVLRLVYTVFVGVLLAMFVGVGITAFYPEPKWPEEPILLKLYKLPTEPVKDSTIAAQLQKEQETFDEAQQVFRKKFEKYNRNVSVVSLISAVLMLIISLTLLRRIPIIADGLLLGGVTTLLYSMIRGFGSGSDKFRFIIVSVGLAVSLILGYVKFIEPAKNK